MKLPKFVISLDFELFWGLGDTQTIAGYGRNVLGEWQAIPRLLALFREYGINVTWATVGMIMCANYQHWRDIRPAVLPTYSRAHISPYRMDDLVRENPKLFFARPLVEQILAAPGQELATHTYSHFYCGEAGATPEQFAADLACARAIAAGMGVSMCSAVFPRNQLVEPFLAALPPAGIRVYRGNSPHWLYRTGDAVPGGIAGRVVRFLDACLPLSGNGTVQAQPHGALVNLPASLFLYPWSARRRASLPLRLQRIRRAMTRAARTAGVFHLWWHPHNFGADLEQNLALLERVLQHYRVLADTYGMQSCCMEDFAHSAHPEAAAGRTAAPQDAPLHSLSRDPR